MLLYLNIKGFGVFENVSLELGQGLSVFTGETGAGKSMVVDAVLAAIGHRISKEIIRHGHERASVELLVDKPNTLDDIDNDSPLHSVLEDSHDIVLSRDILVERSYLRINGRICTMSMAQDIGAYLVDIHGQQEHHSLMRPQKYISVIDSLCREEIEPLKMKFRSLYLERQSLIAQISEFAKDDRDRQREIDLLTFQVEEILNANLNPQEEETLREEHKILSSMENLIHMCDQVYDLLYEGGGMNTSVNDNLNEAQGIMKKVVSIDSSSQEVLDALDQTAFSLEAAIDIFRSYRNNLSSDPTRLQVVVQRLDFIQRLKSKYGRTLEDVINYGYKAQQQLDRLVRADELKKEIEEKLLSIESKMLTLGEEMSNIRGRIAEQMSQDVTETLTQLGMPNAKFEAVITRDEDADGLKSLDGSKTIRVREDGIDRASFLFCANAGSPPMPLARVASGGELSRVMLAVKAFMARVDPVPTLIFDEIDAGIGGKAGQKVAEKLHTISRDKQVLCVTHLPSIAAMADNHYVIEKLEKDGSTTTTVRKVTGDQRIREIARMLSGTELDVSLEHARELLNMAENYKKKSRA
jgi:DNA repair protein RecN (Recombination protein N)